MTVKELIKKLQTFDPDVQVYFAGDGYTTIKDEEIFTDGDKCYVDVCRVC